MASCCAKLITIAVLIASTSASLSDVASRAGSGGPIISISSTSPYSLQIRNGQQVVENTAILAGHSNSSVSPVTASANGNITHGDGHISTTVINSQVVKVSVNSTYNFVGAKFSAPIASRFFGVWEYPWNDRQLDNEGVEFDFKGLGNSAGVNWDNARSPFFLSDAGYGIYADTLEMGSFNFKQPGCAEFIFNGSSLVYYIIVPSAARDFKGILTAFAALSNTIDMPPDSGYGPTFWSDDFEEDFYGNVHNAQENYYDVINHLYDHQIHATSMFADRPYGTGNSSFGNFDFDMSDVDYPTPRQFIANLTKWGYDFQVWVANRAFLDTQLYDKSVAEGWLFPGINPEFFLGPALNLSIPAAYQYFKERLSYFPSVGVKGYKIDRGEEGEMPVYEQNIQATLFEQLCYETMVEKWGPGNFYDFARSAVDRSRSKTAVWNGDSHSNYSGLSYSIASGIRAGLIGFSQWGSDTGGYIRNLDDPKEDLWARWMWFSTFSPVYEIMIGTNHTPWYPTTVNPYTSELVDILKQTANLHHDLLPYIKSYTYQAHKTGVPVIRAAFLEAPDDLKAFDLKDEYFFGSEMLIAPITSASGRRSVYFPRGAHYLEYFNKTTVHPGGSTVEIELNLHSVPAYVRAGSILPRGDIYQGNNKWTRDWRPELTIELYPSNKVRESSFMYYNGDAQKEVQVKMSMDPDKKCVTVQYEAVGINGTLSLYDKRGIQKTTLLSGGGTATFENVDSLFNE